jgi:hypothetical protein
VEIDWIVGLVMNETGNSKRAYRGPKPYDKNPYRDEEEKRCEQWGAAHRHLQSTSLAMRSSQKE